MATAKQEEVDPLLDSVTCSLCMEVLDDPRSLQCMHSFCRKCIQDMMDKHRDKKSFPCPICREDCPIPDKGAAGLKVNFFVNSVLDIAKDRSGSSKEAWNCDICLEENEHVPAISKCLDCNEKLCKGCNRAHKRSRISKLHKILELSGDTSKDTHAAMDMLSKRTLYCQVHTQEPLKYFCKKDQLLICQDCFAFYHQGHQLENIEQTANATLKNLSSIIDLGKQRSAKYEKDISEGHIRKQNLERNIDDATSKLEKDQKLVQAHVEAHFKALKAEVKAMGIAAVKNIVTYLAGLQFDKDAIDGTVNQLENLQEHGHPADIVYLIPEMNTKHEVWSVPPVTSDTDCVTKIEVKRSNLKIEGIDFAQVDIFKHATHQLIEREFGCLTVLYNDHIVTVNSATKEAMFYDENFIFKKTTKLNQAFGAWTQTNDNCFAVINQCDDGSRKIDIYSDNGIYSRSVPVKLYGITHDIVNNHENEFVMQFELGGPAIACVNSTSGNIVQKNRLSYPLHGNSNMAVNSKDNIIVTSINGIRGVKLKKNEKPEVIFDYADCEAGILWPYVDHKDNIIVLNKQSKKVQLLTPDGSFVKTLMNPSNSNCEIIDVGPNSKGELVVGAYHNGSYSERCMFKVRYMSEDGQIL